MIYVSSTCSQKLFINEAVKSLAEYGFRNIELSGGTQYYPNFLDDLGELKDKYNLNYRLHNYFPPPQKPFVLNLATTNDINLNKSKEMIKQAIAISKLYNSNQLGIHAGFRISPKVEELGKTIEMKDVDPYRESLNKFIVEFKEMYHWGEENGVTLFLENNVFSAKNALAFKGENPFFLTGLDEYLEMKKLFNFPLLLDVAHLKVSCVTRQRNFEHDLVELLAQTQYIHLSDNDGTCDSNQAFSEKSDFYEILKGSDMTKKTFTIEVYDELKNVAKCSELLGKII